MNSNKTLIVFMLLIGAYLAMSPLNMMSNIDIKGPSKSKLRPSIAQKMKNLSDLEDVFEDSKTFFNILDQDGDGNISAKELNHLLLLLGEKIPFSSVKAMIAKLDDDSNGSISLKEFVSLKPEEQTELKESIEDMIISKIQNRKGDATEEEDRFVYCVLEQRELERLKYKGIVEDMKMGFALKDYSPKDFKDIVFSPEDMKASKGFSLKELESLHIQGKSPVYKIGGLEEVKGFKTKKGKANNLPNISLEDMKYVGMSPEEMKKQVQYRPTKGKHYKCNYRDEEKKWSESKYFEEMKKAGISPEPMTMIGRGKYEEKKED